MNRAKRLDALEALLAPAAGECFNLQALNDTELRFLAAMQDKQPEFTQTEQTELKRLYDKAKQTN